MVNLKGILSLGWREIWRIICNNVRFEIVGRSSSCRCWFIINEGPLRSRLLYLFEFHDTFGRIPHTLLTSYDSLQFFLLLVNWGKVNLIYWIQTASTLTLKSGLTWRLSSTFLFPLRCLGSLWIDGASEVFLFWIWYLCNTRVNIVPSKGTLVSSYRLLFRRLNPAWGRIIR